MKFHVPDMSCNHCVNAITEAVKSIDAEATVSADLEAKTVDVKTSANHKHVAQALADAGYAPSTNPA